MPRLAPDGCRCIEHRITFGTSERRQLQSLARSYSRDKWLENIPNMIGAGAIGAGIYYGMKYGGAAIGAGLDIAKDAADFIEETYHDLENAAKGLNPDGTPTTSDFIQLDGTVREIETPLAGTGLGGVSHVATEVVTGILNFQNQPARWVWSGGKWVKDKVF